MKIFLSILVILIGGFFAVCGGIAMSANFGGEIWLILGLSILLLLIPIAISKPKLLDKHNILSEGKDQITFRKIILSILLFALLSGIYTFIILFLVDIFSHNIYISEEFIFGLSGLLGFILYIYLCHRWFVRFPKTLLLILVNIPLLIGILVVGYGGIVLLWLDGRL